jgi:transcriptional regulator with XRE-family HTH domain
MSTIEYNYESNGFEVPIPRTTPSNVSKPVRKYHRIQEVCNQQGATVRSLSRKMDLSANDIREQENPQADLRISDLLKWQKVLEVPLADLLVDNEGPLSEPVSRRAKMLRVMKTAKAILETAHDRSVKRLASMLVTQLTEIMPELAEVSAWHTVGQRRTQNEMGRIVDRTIPDNFFNDSNH